jgi:drug/metabolite transporter (DMT)-like permease
MDANGIVLICLAALLWGIVPLAEVRYMTGVSLITVAALFLGLAVLVSPFAYLLYRRTLHEELPTLLTHNRHVVVYGTIGIVLSLAATAAYLQVLKLGGGEGGKGGNGGNGGKGAKGGGSNTAIVVAATCVYPVVTAVLMWSFYGHAISWLAWLGISLVVLGLMLLGSS